MKLFSSICRSQTHSEIPHFRDLKLNKDAIILYKNHGIHLEQEPLEIAVCNQHLNGGVRGDIWWETNIPHLFAIGEVNGSHGIHRPGGAALNSGQVGGLRAAQRIAHVYNNDLKMKNGKLINLISTELKDLQGEIDTLLRKNHKKEQVSAGEILLDIQDQMSQVGGIVRPLAELPMMIGEVEKLITELQDRVKIKKEEDILSFFRIKDALITQRMFLESFLDYHNNFGKSRGSYIIARRNLNSEYEEKYKFPPGKLKRFKFITNTRDLSNQIQEISYNQEKIRIKWVSVREIPEKVGWFEKTWKKFQKEEIYKDK